MALAGNPNSGKTTVFNHYTGSRQHVANYPGITVERKEGFFKAQGHNIRMLDLPGTYALTAYSQDELVARRGMTGVGRGPRDKNPAPDAIIDVLNASALERNLYLSVQILELGLPLVLALNMYDEARAQGVEINTERLSELLGVPVVPTVARNGEGLQEALKSAIDLSLHKREALRALSLRDGAVAPPHLTPGQGAGAAVSTSPEAGAGQTTPGGQAGSEPPHHHGPLFISYGPDLDPVLEELTGMVKEAGLFENQYPPRWVALKFLENDAEIREKTHAVDKKLGEQLEAKVEEVAKHIATTTGSYPEAIIADYRYGFIASILKQGVITRRDELEARRAMSDRVDRVLTHRLGGPLILLGLLYLMYQITFGLGEIPMGWVESFFGWLNETVSDNMSDGLLKSMIVSGVIDGVGGVMGFVPLILVMFLLISFLEDSGYMARVAYMLDRVFRAFGLHGYSVMPFIISGGIAGGCAVPGVMATRTLRSPKEKLATMLTAPFMTCGAKLPVFLLLVAVFFPNSETEVMLGLSLLAWAMALLVSLLLRSTIIKGESTPFVMELPPYRLPTLFGVLIHTWERVWQYIKKAGTVILAISIIIWAAMTFPEMPEDLTAPYETRIAAAQEAVDAAPEEGEEREALEEELALAENALSGAALEYSIAGRVGKTIENVTSVAGFDWRTNIALVGGIGAKEVIVSTLGTAYSLGETDPEEAESLQTRIGNDSHWNKANALALMVFVLLYAPCFVTVVMIKQESGSWKWAAFSIIFNTALAFVAAVGVYQVGLLVIGS
ncbi:ferrous iron transport protein B [Desulfovibrio sp. OttesenSCG-928-C14]|nr:ferrous iron transport protein B [Desulfovibrio sp. OttesenSCG-928-C14]